MRTLDVSVVCPLAAEEFWSLRMDQGFDKAMASNRGGGFEVLDLEESTDSEGLVVVNRTSLLTYKENPIPAALRGMMGTSDDFFFKVRTRWFRDRFDASHAMTFTSEPPVMAKRIRVGGTQWVEPISPTECRVKQRTTVSVNVMGVGRSVEGALAHQRTLVMHNLEVYWPPIARLAQHVCRLFHSYTQV